MENVNKDQRNMEFNANEVSIPLDDILRDVDDFDHGDHIEINVR